MTPTELRDALAALRWSQRGLADATGHDERQAWRWAAGQAEIPADLAAWLRLAAAWFRANPPPQRQARHQAAPEA